VADGIAVSDGLGCGANVAVTDRAGVKVGEAPAVADATTVDVADGVACGELVADGVLVVS
jgi:hypothetical protein